MPRHAVACAPLFFEVPPSGGATVHLLGSIHVGPPRGWLLPPVVEAAFARSDALVFETDVTGLTRPDFLHLERKTAWAPHGSSLSDLVSEQTLRMLEERIDQLGYDVDPVMAHLERYRPWYAARWVAPRSRLGRHLEGSTGVEDDLLRRAGDRELLGLETPETVVERYGKLAPELDELMLRHALERARDEDESLPVLVEAWRRGDVPTLVALTRWDEPDTEAFAALRTILETEREAAMAEGIAALATDPARAGEHVFVAIGAAHLVGEGNVRRRLAERYGLEVRRIDTRSPDVATTVARESAHAR